MKTTFVGASSAGRRARTSPHLADHLRGRQVARRPQRRGGAEPAPHATARLRRHAQRAARRAGDEYALDPAAVGQAEQIFLGAVGRVRPGQAGRPRRAELVRQFPAQGRGQVGHAVEVVGPPGVEPVEDLRRAVRWVAAAGEPGFQLGLGEILEVHAVREDGFRRDRPRRRNSRSPRPRSPARPSRGPRSVRCRLRSPCGSCPRPPRPGWSLP